MFFVENWSINSLLMFDVQLYKNQLNCIELYKSFNCFSYKPACDSNYSYSMIKIHKKCIYKKHMKTNASTNTLKKCFSVVDHLIENSILASSNCQIYFGYLHTVKVKPLPPSGGICCHISPCCFYHGDSSYKHINHQSLWCHPNCCHCYCCCLLRLIWIIKKAALSQIVGL